MVAVGYTLLCEQTGPKELVDHAIRAEDAGGPDPEPHVAAFRKFVDAGFAHVTVVQVGGNSKPVFLDWAREELLPRLRES